MKLTISTTFRMEEETEKSLKSYMEKHKDLSKNAAINLLIRLGEEFDGIGKEVPSKKEEVIPEKEVKEEVIENLEEDEDEEEEFDFKSLNRGFNTQEALKSLVEEDPEVGSI
jgi:hypothetical protein